MVSGIISISAWYIISVHYNAIINKGKNDIANVIIMWAIALSFGGLITFILID